MVKKSRVLVSFMLGGVAMAFFSCPASAAIQPVQKARNFTFINQCPQTVWVGSLNSTAKDALPSEGGWKLQAGQSKTIAIADQWSGRFWGRSGCKFGSQDLVGCTTGDCGSREKCSGIGGRTPASLAEFTLQGSGGQDFYDLSLVDGYNLPMKVAPKPGTFSKSDQKNKYECGIAECQQDLNTLCPPELQMKDFLGTVVGCLSACEKFNTDQYCCRNAYGTPEKCPPTHYSKIFKKACPTAYSYAYDDQSSTFTCKGRDYEITFCPDI
jgi:hypothetical protein